MGNPVKTVKRQLLRIGSCALSVLLVLGSIPAAAIGDGVTATYDEAYRRSPAPPAAPCSVCIGRGGWETGWLLRHIQGGWGY